MLGIPKKLTHIWIGDLPPPHEWMESWKYHHPEWEYFLADNRFILNRKFHNQVLINEYIRRLEFAGAADLIRYEILFEFGGLIPEADSLCLQNTDKLWSQSCAYTVFENEVVREKMVSPIMASEPGNKFVSILIDELSNLKPYELGAPWRTTGNLFIAQMIERHAPGNLTIFPSYYFIPTHYTGHKHEGSGPVYAHQMFGTTQKLYESQLGRAGQFKRKARKVLTKLHIHSIRRLALKLYTK